MFAKKIRNSPVTVLGSMISASLGLRLLAITLPIRTLLQKFLVDDAFYYFSLSRNIISGNGVVFNQGVITNGFHPLYELLLLPIFKLTYPLGPNVPIRLALVLLSVFTVATAIPLYVIGIELFDTRTGLFAAGLWLFNPYVLFISLTGLETPIQIFFIALLTMFLLTRDNRTDFVVWESISIGILLGLIFWSRMDGVFIALGVGLTLVLRHLNAANWSITALTDRDLWLIGGVASLIVAPWLLWNVFVAGRLTPVSGSALRYLRFQDHSYLELVYFSITKTAVFITNFFAYPASTTATRLLVLIVALVLPAAFLLQRTRSLPRATLTRIDFLIVSIGLYYVFYWFYQLGLRPWYALFTLFFVTLGIAAILTQISTYVSRPRVYYGAIVLLLCTGFLSTGIGLWTDGNAPQAALKYETAQYLQTMPDDTTIASFNTGIYQYYTPNHDVLNLDGVMNVEAYHARADGRLTQYFQRHSVDYIVDSPSQLQEVKRTEISLHQKRDFTMTKTLRGVQRSHTYRVAVVNMSSTT